jgi:hypothetical protein
MSCSRWPAALMAACVGATQAPAQALLVPAPYPSGGLSYTAAKGHRILSLYLSSGPTPGFVLGPSLFGPFGYSRFGQMTVFYATPPPLLVGPLAGPRLIPEERPPRMPEADADQPEELPLPGQPAGRFRPLEPGNRARAQEPVKPEPPEKVKPPLPKPPEPPPVKPPEKPKEAPKPPPQQAEQEPDFARLVALAREAFAKREYGRAAERLRQAIALAPREPEARFLLGQVQFGLGKYGDAVEAIHLGLAVQPDWPNAAFRPLDLYGPHVADYSADLRRLEDVLNQHPDDPVLLFLYAYELWFDGRKEEARPLFQRAATCGADAADVGRFLLEAIGGPVL